MVVHARYPLGEPRVERESKSARDAGFDVTVVCLREPGERTHEVVDGISVLRLPVRHVRGRGITAMAVEYTVFTLAASAAVLGLWRKGRFAVVHVHAPPDFLAFAGLLPRLLGARVVLDIHDLSPHMFGARVGGGRLVDSILKAVERAACAISHQVVTVHEPYRRELGAHGIDVARIQVVMNAVDEELVANALQSRLRSGDAFVVAYHGTLTQWYGVDILVEAVAALAPDLPQLMLRILGEGDALADLQQRALQLGVADRTEFSGCYLPIADALASVAGASCGVIPNRPSTLNRFALSSKLFEYVALEVPVIVARLETLASHFDRDEVTFFEPGDTASLADAIRWVAEHPEHARERALRALRRARDYSWRSQRENLLHAYEQRT
jgi:glycosyltransferase involved in cell wall biosynthesis